MIFVDTSKYAIGRHRPNFYRSCEPRIAKYTSSNGAKELHECHTLGQETKFNYIVDYECTTKNSGFFDKDIHLSFMSGHAATMMFVAIYVSIILVQRLRKHLDTTMGRVVVGLCIILLVDLAFFVGYTRISDYMHHPTDVITGYLFGIVVAVFVKLFIDRSKCLTKDEVEKKPQTFQMKTIENNLPEMV